MTRRLKLEPSGKQLYELFLFLRTTNFLIYNPHILYFSSDTTLREVINSAKSSRFPDLCGIVYMRKPYVNDSLDSTTLSALGLADQSAKFQLQYISCSIDLTGSLGNNSTESIAVADNPLPDMFESLSEEVKNDFNESGAPSSAMEVDNSNVDPGITTVSGAIDIAGLNVADNAEIHLSKLVPLIELSAEPDSLLDEATVKSSCDTALKYIMDRNFDAASSAAVTIFLKYIDNMIRFPNVEKYSRISTGNKIFVEKISRVQGNELFFSSIGFVKASKVQSNEPTTYCLNPGLRNIHTSAYWLQVRMSLEAAGRDLGIDPELLRPPVLEVESPPAPPCINFDPFKAILTRTTLMNKSESNSSSGGMKDREPALALVTTTTVLGGSAAGSPAGPNPARGETDTLLANMEERRRILEGDPSAILRRTTVSCLNRMLFFMLLF
jgi:hypothetical protein